MLEEKLKKEGINTCDFHDFVTDILKEITPEEKLLLYDKPISFISFLPLAKDSPIDFSKGENLIKLEAVKYAQMVNAETVNKYIANRILEEIFGISGKEEFTPKLVTNKKELYNLIFKNSIYTPELIKKMEPFEFVEKNNPQIIIPNTNSTANALRILSQKRNNDNIIKILDDLEKETIDIEMYRVHSKRVEKFVNHYFNLFFNFKLKTSESSSKKGGLSILKKPSFEISDIDSMTYTDTDGFEVTTPEIIPSNNKTAYKNSVVAEIVDFLVGAKDINFKYKNYYLKNERDMKGIIGQGSINKSEANIEFPFPNILIRSSILQASIHLNDAYTKAQNNLGGKEKSTNKQKKPKIITAHPNYKTEMNEKERLMLKEAGKSGRTKYIANKATLFTVDDLTHLKSAYELNF